MFVPMKIRHWPIFNVVYGVLLTYKANTLLQMRRQTAQSIQICFTWKKTEKNVANSFNV